MPRGRRAVRPRKEGYLPESYESGVIFRELICQRKGAVKFCPIAHWMKDWKRTCRPVWDNDGIFGLKIDGFHGTSPVGAAPIVEKVETGVVIDTTGGFIGGPISMVPDPLTTAVCAMVGSSTWLATSIR